MARRNLLYLGFEVFEIIIIVVISLAICITVCSIAMEAAVLFSPAFIFLFPVLITDFPTLTVNEAIGLAFIIELFGYSSSVTGYWKRRQIDFNIVKQVLIVTIPAAIAFRFFSFAIDPQVLLTVFGVILLTLAALIFRSRNSLKQFSDAPQSYRPRTCALCLMKDRDTELAKFTKIPMQSSDRGVLSSGGAFAGLIGIAIGEITNTYLLLRKRVPVKISTGTSAFILHLTILSALIANFAVIGGLVPFLRVESFQIPLNVAAIIAPTVVLGGQIGAYINSRLKHQTIVRILMLVYTLVGVVILTRISFG
ncbi:MAG: sulfite exporter TauE/SafE family protein [Candidatus Bathyarchaeia archaeon]